MIWHEEIFLKESTIQKKKCLLISMSLVLRIWFHHGKTPGKYGKRETGKSDCNTYIRQRTCMYRIPAKKKKKRQILWRKKVKTTKMQKAVHRRIYLNDQLLGLSDLSNCATPWTAATQTSCPSLSPGVCSNSCSLTWVVVCHPTVSSSVLPFFSCSQ